MGRTSLVCTIVAVTTLLLVGCWVDPYPEDRGVNLLEDRGLGAADFVDAYFAGVVPAFDYINYDGTIGAAEYGVITGLPAGADATIHRLELHSLLPKGDFENHLVDSDVVLAGAQPELWDTAIGVPYFPPADFRIVASGLPDYGNYIQFNVSSGQHARFDLDGLLDGFAEPGAYHLQLEFDRNTSDTEITFDYGDGGASSYLDLVGVSWTSLEGEPAGTFEEIPTRSVAELDLVNVFTSIADTGPADNFFYVGTPKSAQPQDGFLDNVRIGRVDIFPHMSLGVPPAAGTQLPFVPGIYTFSVYVKSEIAAQVTPTTNNAFRAGQISLGVNDAFLRISRAEGGWNPSQWIKVSRTFTLDVQDIASTPVMTLQISVTDSAEPAVGRILIADPSVTLGAPESGPGDRRRYFAISTFLIWSTPDATTRMK